MLKPKIADREELYRAVPAKPHMWKKDRPTSLVFSDSLGTSVDRNGKRSCDDVCASLRERLEGVGTELQAIVMVTARQCRDVQAHPIAKPCPDNPHHGEIHDAPGHPRVSKTKARKLAEQCTRVKNYTDGRSS